MPLSEQMGAILFVISRILFKGDHIKHGEVLVDVEIESNPNCLATQLSEL